MPKPKGLRRRPSTPNLKVDHAVRGFHHEHQLTADPNSPPETPTTSPPVNRKISLKPRRQPDFRDYYQPLDSDPNIKPVGNGHQFSYQPKLGPEQLSPRSVPSSDTDESSDDETSSDDASIGSLPDRVDLEFPDDVDEDLSDSEDSRDSDDSDDSKDSDEAETSHLTATTTTVICNFTIEEFNPMDSDCEGLDVLQPTEIESNCSRSRSRRKELDSEAMHELRTDLQNLNCSNETSDNDDEETFYRWREERRKYRRMSMGSSFGKRTHSELSDSDDDGEALDVNDVGSSARRLRRKLQRTSLLFHDPPPARIDELEEPDSSEDERVTGQLQGLARELPYWAMDIMEMDSS